MRRLDDLASRLDDLAHGLGRAVARWPSPVRRLVVVGIATGRAVGHDRANVFAAAIAYRVLFSIFPLALGLVAVAGFVLRDADLRDQASRSASDHLPISDVGRDAVASVLSTVAGGAATATAVAIPGLLWAGSGMVGAVRVAIDAAFGKGRERRNYVVGKALDLAFVLLVGLLALASTILTVVGERADAIRQATAGWAEPLPTIVDLLAGSAVPAIVAAATFAMFLSLYRVLPASPPGRGALVVGALIATVAFEALRRGFAIYVTRFATFSSVYGSLGAVIAFLFFVYLAAMVLIVGAQVAAAWRATDGGRRPVGLPARLAVAGASPRTATVEPTPPAAPLEPAALLRAGATLVALAAALRLRGRRGGGTGTPRG